PRRGIEPLPGRSNPPRPGQSYRSPCATLARGPVRKPGRTPKLTPVAHRSRIRPGRQAPRASGPVGRDLRHSPAVAVGVPPGRPAGSGAASTGIAPRARAPVLAPPVRRVYAGTPSVATTPGGP